MATVLFIRPQDLKRNSIINGNVDVDKLLFHIKEAQQIHIKNYLGTDLYNKITSDIQSSSLSGNYLTLVNDYVQPMLIYYAYADYLPFASYSIGNGGVYKHTSENSESAPKEEIDFLVSKIRDKAEYYTRRFIDYMTYNQSSFPEYTSNTNDDVSPDYDANFQGWQL